MTIERLNKLKIQDEVKEYIKDVGENFIYAVYGKELPKELFEVIKKSVFEQSFIRTAYSNNIYLHDFNDKYIDTVPQNIKPLLKQFRENTADSPESFKDLVVFKTWVQYSVKNVSSLGMQYDVIFWIDKPFAGKYEGLCGITSVLVDREQLIAGDGYFSNDTTDENEETNLLKFKHTVEIPAGKSVKVSIEGYSLRPNDDNETWYIPYPQQGANLSVTDADGNKYISISLRTPRLTEGEYFAEKDPKTNAATLETDQYLVPYQSFVAKWTPRLDA
jgi:hypothetical protein